MKSILLLIAYLLFSSNTNAFEPSQCLKIAYDNSHTVISKTAFLTDQELSAQFFLTHPKPQIDLAVVYEEVPYSQSKPEEKHLNHLRLKLNSSNIELVVALFSDNQSQQKVRQMISDHLKDRPNEPFDLKNLLPEFARTHTDIVSKCYGPNCWGATLNWFDPIVGETQVDSETLINTIVGSGKYQQVKNNEGLKFGDVVLILEDGSGPMELRLGHTMIYIHDDIFWHKRDRYGGSPWTFERFESAVLHYKKSQSAIDLPVFRKVK